MINEKMPFFIISEPSSFKAYVNFNLKAGMFCVKILICRQEACRVSWWRVC